MFLFNFNRVKENYPSGNVYIRKKDYFGQRQDYGTFYFVNGNKYWKYGKANGFCVLTWSKGSKYEGDWKNDKRSGSEKYFDSNGDSYEGDWKYDRINDFGI